MVKITAGLVRYAVKWDWKNEVRNFLVHAAKVWINFGIWKLDFAFLKIPPLSAQRR